VISAIFRASPIRLFGMEICAILAACATGCDYFAAAKSTSKAPAPVVVVRTVEQKSVSDYFEFPGQTAAVEAVEIRARVTGYLVKVCFEDGQNVKKGDSLYEIDPRPYQAALEQSQGELARLEALLQKAVANMARSERLRPTGAISEDEYEQHKADLAGFRASIKAAMASVREAKLNLEFTSIKSPIDGRVSRTRITEGNLIQPGSGDAAILTTVVSTDPIYVYFDMDENAMLAYSEASLKNKLLTHPKRLKDMKIPVEIGLANENGFSHRGILDFADNQVERTTGTLRMRGIFDNAKDSLTPGLFVRVRIPYGEKHDALLISERAICRDQREQFVNVVTAENKIAHRFVKLGGLHDGLREIKSGIGLSDRIVVKGLQSARLGIEVAPIDEATATARATVGGGSSPSNTRPANASGGTKTN
jgi:membrane fusion protein, multidrug efflux system